MTKHSATAAPRILNWPGAPPELKGVLDVELAAAKRNFAQWLRLWLDQRPGPKDSIVTTIALLETALDRYLAERAATPSDLSAAAADALEMLQPILRRAVQRRRAALRIHQSAKAPPVPVNDKECVSRLTEMLKLLDALAGLLPKNAALRQFIGDAAEPLETLLGYFIGGIDKPGDLDTTARSRSVPLPLAPGSEPTPAVPAPEAEIRPPPPPPEVEEW